MRQAIIFVASNSQLPLARAFFTHPPPFEARIAEAKTAGLDSSGLVRANHSVQKKS
jgi:hypothetical protein